MSQTLIIKTLYSAILTITIYSTNLVCAFGFLSKDNTENKKYIIEQDYYIVCLKSEYKNEIYRVMETLQQRDDFQGEILPLLLIKGFAAHLSHEAKEWLESLDEVDYIELDDKVETQQIKHWQRQVVSDL